VRTLYSLFRDREAALDAVDRLRLAGVADRDIIVRSGEPLDDCELGQRDRGTWLPWISTAGGLVGLAAGTWLPRATAAGWPISTGGIPASSWWPNLIIVFELTMLGAILATVAGLIVTAGLISRSTPIREPALADGWILVGVATPKPIAHIEEALDPGGVGSVKTVN